MPLIIYAVHANSHYIFVILFILNRSEQNIADAAESWHGPDHVTIRFLEHTTINIHITYINKYTSVSIMFTASKSSPKERHILHKRAIVPTWKCVQNYACILCYVGVHIHDGYTVNLKCLASWRAFAQTRFSVDFPGLKSITRAWPCNARNTMPTILQSM